MIHKLAKYTFLVGIPGASGYYIGRYVGGSGFRSHNSDEMEELVRSIEPDSQIQPHAGKSSGYDSIVASTVPQASENGIVTSYSFCGQHSVGFPTMVHGGLLATLLKQHLGENQGVLKVRYLQPTFVDKLLRFETQTLKNDRKTLIYSDYSPKPLVEATMTTAAPSKWFNFCFW